MILTEFLLDRNSDSEDLAEEMKTVIVRSYQA